MDERNLQEIIDEIKVIKNKAPNYDLETYDRFLSWLNSLKDRYVWKQSDIQMISWSEEDKRKLNRIYSILSEATDTHAFSTSCKLIGDKKYIELQDFLKSIVHQNIWKPSNEQMLALRQVISGCSYDIEPLLELETKLKEF